MFILHIKSWIFGSYIEIGNFVGTFTIEFFGSLTPLTALKGSKFLVKWKRNLQRMWCHAIQFLKAAAWFLTIFITK